MESMIIRLFGILEISANGRVAVAVAALIVVVIVVAKSVSKASVECPFFLPQPSPQCPTLQGCITAQPNAQFAYNGRASILEIALILIAATVALGGAFFQIGFLRSENRALRAMLDHHRDNAPIRVDDLVRSDAGSGAEQPMPRHTQAQQSLQRSH